MANVSDEMPERREQPSGWAVGWTAFAAMMMILMGVWWVIVGMVAIMDPGFYVVDEEWVFRFDASSWGWVHLILGLVTVPAGFALFSGAVWARTLGVIFAAVAGLVAFAWLPWYPIWAIVFLVTSGAVIWALTAHGRDITVA